MPVSWTKWLLYYVCTRINSLPRPKSGQAKSTRELFKGVKLDYSKDMCLSFGEYAQVYRAPAKPNSQEQRLSGAIALCPKDNYSRYWIFLDLNTGYIFPQQMRSIAC